MLTALQIDSMRTLSQHVGQTVGVLTSQNTANVNPSFVSSAKGIHSSASLRGLERKGYLRIDNAFWKGATITVIKALDEGY
jgi:hypothetical protein